MNWADLTKKIAGSARISYSDLLKQHGDEKFYAFILYTDHDGYTVLPSANSIEKYDKKVADKKITDAKRLAGYKWYIGEWAYEAWQADNFDEICESLGSANEALPDQDQSLLMFKKNVHSCMTDALGQLDREGFFGTMRDDVVLFISSTDYEESLKLENESARILNAPAAYEKFLKRYTV